MNLAKGTTFISIRELRATAEVAFDVVYHVELFPTFMPHIQSVEILSGDENRKQVLWHMTIDGAPLIWTEDIVYDRANFLAEFAALDGAFSRFDGSWRATPTAHGSRLEVSVLYSLGLPEIEDIIGPILEARLRENLEAMLDSIDKRIAAK
jgi:uncharacterized membrane protein